MIKWCKHDFRHPKGKVMWSLVYMTLFHPNLSNVSIQVAGCIACEGIFTWAIIIEGSHLQGPMRFQVDLKVFVFGKGTWKIGYPRYLADWYTIGSIVSMVPGNMEELLQRSERVDGRTRPTVHPRLWWPRVWSPRLRLVLPIPAFVLNEKTVWTFGIQQPTLSYLFKPSDIFTNDSEAVASSVLLILGFISVKAWQR